MISDAIGGTYLTWLLAEQDFIDFCHGVSLKSYFQYKLTESFLKTELSFNFTSYNMYHKFGYKLHDTVIKQNAV
jgi:hypothetical protein